MARPDPSAILRQYLRAVRPSVGRPLDPMPQIISSSGHEEDRQTAFKLLADLGGKEFLDEVKRTFKEDADGFVRRDAADRLVSLAGNEATGLLLGGLGDRSPGVRYHVCELLGVAGGTEAAVALRKVAEADPYRDDKGEYPVRKEAGLALQKMDMLTHDGLLDRLVREATSKDSDLRFWAIERLGEMKGQPAAADTLMTLLKDPSPVCTCGHNHVRQAAAESLRRLGKKVVEKENAVYEVPD